MSFYVSITTIAHYKPALDMLLSSLPSAWKRRYILVYQKEDRNDHRVFEDGHIEVYMTQNLSDYGHWVGLHMLLSRGVVPHDSSFLCIHDTCMFVDGDRCDELMRGILAQHPDDDVVWLCDTGQCNICVLRKAAIDVGYERYKDIGAMTKRETIDYEWYHGQWRSPKSFPVKHAFLPSKTCECGTRPVYSAQNERHVLFYPSISMEKYYYLTHDGLSHPLSP